MTEPRAEAAAPDRSDPIPADILAFLDAYRDAFNALDGPAVAALYAVPSAIAQEGSFTHWPTREPIVHNMTALCALYAGRGYVRAGYETERFFVQGQDHAVADLRWQIEWASGPAWRFNTTYNLVRTPEGWRVLLCTAYAERQLMTSADAAGR